MNDFDRRLRDALGGQPAMGDKAEALKKEAMRMFENKLLVAKILTWVSIGLSTVGFVVAMVGFMSATLAREYVIYGIIFFAAMELQVLMKLWFWIIHSRITIQKELKEIQLQLAEHMAAEKKAEG